MMHLMRVSAAWRRGGEGSHDCRRCRAIQHDRLRCLWQLSGTGRYQEQFVVVSRSSTVASWRRTRHRTLVEGCWDGDKIVLMSPSTEREFHAEADSATMRRLRGIANPARRSVLLVRELGG